MGKDNKTTGPVISRAAFIRGTGAGLVTAAMLPISGAMAARGAIVKRRIPSSGEKLPVIGLGTAKSFGYPRNQAGFETRKEVLRILLGDGARVIDTSPTYGGAEKVVGRALAELGLRAKAFVATKISIRGQQRGIAQNAQSAVDLRTNKFDLLQVHNLKDTAAHLETIARLKGEGRVKYAGITHFYNSAHGVLARTIRREKLDFVQLDYSIVNRAAERELLPLARDRGVAVMVNVPFARGDLFAKVRGHALPAWAVEFEAASWGQFFLKFVAAHRAVTVIIPGTSRPRHMRDNLGAGRGRLPTRAHRKKMIDLIESL